MPQPGQPSEAVGDGVISDFQEVVFEFRTGSVVPSVVVGCGLGVTVMVAGGNVVPPITVVLPPSVNV